MLFKDDEGKTEKPTPEKRSKARNKGQRDASEYMDVATSRPSKDPSIVAYQRFLEHASLGLQPQIKRARARVEALSASGNR